MYFFLIRVILVFLEESMVHNIQGTLTVNWNSEVKAIVDTWENHKISLDDFKTAVLVKGLNYAKKK